VKGSDVPKVKRSDPIRLRSFGTVRALDFQDGGAAEVLMTWPEVSYLLDAVREFETRKKKPDEKFVDALEVLRKKVHTRCEGIVMLATVPIARWKAEFKPIFRDGTNKRV
jgi:hypothetical protein